MNSMWSSRSAVSSPTSSLTSLTYLSEADDHVAFVLRDARLVI
jgi:hypothetical protein